MLINAFTALNKSWPSANFSSSSGQLGKLKERKIKMFGLGDFGVSLVFILVILSALLCVIYGVINWNKEGAEDAALAAEAREWRAEENKIEEKL